MRMVRRDVMRRLASPEAAAVRDLRLFCALFFAEGQRGFRKALQFGLGQLPQR